MLVSILSGIGGVFGAITAVFTIFFTKNRLASEGKKFAAEADVAAVQAASGVMDMQREIVEQQLAELQKTKAELNEAKTRVTDCEEQLSQMTFRWAKAEEARQTLLTKVDRMESQIVHLRVQVNSLRQNLGEE